MSELPNGWVSTVLGEVLSVRNGYAFKSKDFLTEGVPLVRQSNLNGDSVDLSKCVYLPSQFLLEYERFTLKKGDVLIGMSGSLGKLCLYDKDIVSLQNQRTGKIELHQRHLVSLRFIWHFLKTIETLLLEKGKGIAVANVSAEDIESIPLPLPPLNEQKRIAAKLDALLERVDACRARQERVPLLLKRFRQAVLAAATSGQLTEDWREVNANIERGKELLQRVALRRQAEFEAAIESAKMNGSKKPRKVFADTVPEVESEESWDIPESWAITNIGFLAHVTKLAGFEYTDYFKPTDEGEIPIVRAQNVQMGRFVEENIKYISKDISDFLERSQLHGREVLMVFIGAGTGNVCLAPNDKRWHLAPNVAKIDVDEVDAKYLSFYLQSDFGFSQTNTFIKATAQPSLSMDTIRQIVVFVPPLKEQAEIVRRVETLFAYADRLEARYQQARAEVERLTPALLAKAFRGELVPQDSNDEPAAALLARIQAERAATDTKPRARANSKPVSKSEDSAAPVLPDATRKENAAGRVAVAQLDSPPRNQNGATNGHQPAPLDIDEYDRETLLAAIREVFQQGARYDADSAIRTVSHTLGYARTGARIHERLKTTLSVAVKRGILINEQGEYRLYTRSIADYTQDECVAALLASLPRGWTEREDAIRVAARYLGFRRTGPALRDAFKSAINGAIRRGSLEYDKDLIRKRS